MVAAGEEHSVLVAENGTVFTWGAQAQGRQVLKCPPLPIPEAATQEHERTYGYMLRITQRKGSETPGRYTDTASPVPCVAVGSAP